MVVLDRAGLGFRANIVEKFVMMSTVSHVAVLHKNTVQHVSPGPRDFRVLLQPFCVRQACDTPLRPRGFPCRGALSLGPRDFKVTDTLRPSVCVGTKSFRCAEVLFQRMTYEPPDGHIITVGTKRFRCEEVLFQQSFQ